MSDESVMKVLDALRAVTEAGEVKWARTDAPESAVLSRPQGNVVVGVHRRGSPSDDSEAYRFVSVEFTDVAGDTIWTFHEASRSHPLDRPARALWRAAMADVSEVNQAMSDWLSDLENLGGGED